METVNPTANIDYLRLVNYLHLGCAVLSFVQVSTMSLGVCRIEGYKDDSLLRDAVHYCMSMRIEPMHCNQAFGMIASCSGNAKRPRDRTRPLCAAQTADFGSLTDFHAAVGSTL